MKNSTFSLPFGASLLRAGCSSFSDLRADTQFVLKLYETQSNRTAHVQNCTKIVRKFMIKVRERVEILRRKTMCRDMRIFANVCR